MKRVTLIVVPFILYIVGLLAYYFDKINSFVFFILFVTGLIITLSGFYLYRHDNRHKQIFAGCFLALSLIFLFEYRLMFYEKHTYFVTSYNEPFEIVEDSGIHILSVDIFEAAYIDDLDYLIKTLELSNDQEVLDAEIVTNKIRYNSKNEELLSYIRPAERHFEIMKENVMAYLPETSSAIKDFLNREDFNGDSAGLATVLSGLAEKGSFTNNVPIAVTGAIDGEGNVKEIGSMKAKTLIAEKSGFSHIFIPEENAKEAREVKDIHQLNIEIIEVATVDRAVIEIEKLNT
ncbi:S16 family serine protease [Solibacillus sp. FSL K6-4121]|uniref:S16 family serine protease n=1 Tax=Solibacillus sp. FSL K6-4121 TaxID=2921505 RepID=UPI0030F8F649